LNKKIEEIINESNISEEWIKHSELGQNKRMPNLWNEEED
jgi:hypothetical protein